MKTFLIAASALGVAASYGIVFLPPSTAHDLLWEDGPIEQATMVFFLGACLCLVRAWQLRGADRTPREGARERRIFFLILAVLMFVCAGEEISWGQRIFGWETPETWSAKNAQAETNLHNLVIIEGGVRDAQTYNFWKSLTNANRLFALFTLALFVLVPLCERCSRATQRLLHAIGLPVPPLWLGGLFLLNHAIFPLATRHLVAQHLDSTLLFPLDELKEQNDALVYALAGLAAWLRERARAGKHAPALRKA